MYFTRIKVSEEMPIHGHASCAMRTLYYLTSIPSTATTVNALGREYLSELVKGETALQNKRRKAGVEAYSVLNGLFREVQEQRYFKQ